MKTFDNFLLKHLKLTLFLAIGISWFMIWLRLRTRTPVISTSFVIFKFIGFSILIIFCILMIFKLLKKIITKKPMSSTYFQKKIANIFSYIGLIFEKTYDEYIAQRLFKFRVEATKFWLIISYWHRVIKFLFMDLLGIIVLSSLVFDVIVLKNFYWFPKIAPILIISLVILVFALSIKHEALLYFQIILDIKFRYAPLTIDRDSLELSWELRNQKYKEFSTEAEIAEEDQHICCQFFDNRLENQICSLLRYCLLLLSTTFQLYYMFEDKTIWQQFYSNFEIFFTHQNLTNPYILEIWLLLY